MPIHRERNRQPWANFDCESHRCIVESRVWINPPNTRNSPTRDCTAGAARCVIGFFHRRVLFAIRKVSHRPVMRAAHFATNVASSCMPPVPGIARDVVLWSGLIRPPMKAAFIAATTGSPCSMSGRSGITNHLSHRRSLAPSREISL